MSRAMDPYEICPLDVAHQILKSRMQVHLYKCLKNNGLRGKKICPYNPLHIVNKEDFKEHCKNCEDNVSVHLQELDFSGRTCCAGSVSFESLNKQLNKVMPDNNEWDND